MGPFNVSSASVLLTSDKKPLNDSGLQISEPVSMSLVFAMTTGGVVFLLVSITVFVYLVRSEKLCFTRKYSKSNFPEDITEK